MELSQLLQSRYSVRAYSSDPVEPKKVETVLQAANLAPTACNHQPFRLIVLHTRGREAELRRLCPPGYPADQPAAKRRKTLSKIVRQEHW